MNKIYWSLKELYNFFILISLFLLIVTLIGEEFYAYNVRFDSNYNPCDNNDL